MCRRFWCDTTRPARERTARCGRPTRSWLRSLRHDASGRHHRAQYGISSNSPTALSTEYFASGKFLNDGRCAVASSYSVEMQPKFDNPRLGQARGLVSDLPRAIPQRRSIQRSRRPRLRAPGQVDRPTGGRPADGETPGDENFYKGEGNVWKRRYGGDVQGLIEALPYLQSLGINAIYLNPMFEADSMHKYDTSDYRHIDDNFGFKGDIDAAAKARPTIRRRGSGPRATSSSSTSSPRRMRRDSR